MEIFKLFGSVFVDNEKANKAIDDTDNKGKGLAGTLGGMIGTAAKVGAGIIAGAAAGGAALFGLATKASDYSGAILDASRKSSLTMENLQQLKYAGEQAGVGFDQLIASTAKMNVVFGDAINGNKTAVAAFDELGVSIRNSNGEARSANDVYNDTLTKLAEMGDTAEATRLGTDLFGKGFANLKPLLAEGTAGINDLKNKASELGLVLSDDAIKAGDNFGDTLDSLKAAVGGVLTKIGSEFIPMIQSGADWIMANMPEIQLVFGTVFDAISFVVTAAFDIFQTYFMPILASLWEFVKKYFPSIQQFVVNAFTEIWKIVERVWNLFEISLLPILKALWAWIEPFMPLLGSIVEGAFQVIIDIVNGAISVLETVVGWFQKAIDLAKEFAAWAQGNNTPGVDSNGVTIDAGYTGYATGTSSAKRGWAWVGEQGPEKVFFNGGETVLNNKDSMAGGKTVILQVINQGTIVGANGMKEFARIVSSEMASDYGLAVGGEY